MHLERPQHLYEHLIADLEGFEPPTSKLTASRSTVGAIDPICGFPGNRTLSLCSSDIRADHLRQKAQVNTVESRGLEPLP